MVVLTHLWSTVPVRWTRALGRLLKLDPAAVHDWLCEPLGCVCDPLADHMLEAEIQRWIAEHEHAQSAPPAAV